MIGIKNDEGDLRMSEQRTISLKELLERNCDTFSKKDDSTRGVTTVSASEIVVGDKVVINNYFTLVTE